MFAKTLDFTSLLILARFLGVSGFGVVSMAMTAVLIVEAVSEIPLAAVLLNYERPTDAMYDTAFSLALMRAAVIVIVLSTLSWPLSLLYHEPRLIPFKCALAWAPAMRGLVSPRLAEYARVFDFRRKVALDIMSKAGALVISAMLAITTGSYWAINWQIDKLILPPFVDTATFGRFISADNLIGSLIQNLIDLPLWHQVRSLSRPILAMIPMALFLFALSKIFSFPQKELTFFLTLCWACTLALGIYAGLTLTLWKLAAAPDGYEVLVIRMVKRALGRFNTR